MRRAYHKLAYLLERVRAKTSQQLSETDEKTLKHAMKAAERAARWRLSHPDASSETHPSDRADTEPRKEAQ
jgi:hypothetical protein